MHAPALSALALRAAPSFSPFPPRQCFCYAVFRTSPHSICCSFLSSRIGQVVNPLHIIALELSYFGAELAAFRNLSDSANLC